MDDHFRIETTVVTWGCLVTQEPPHIKTQPTTLKRDWQTHDTRSFVLLAVHILTIEGTLRNSEAMDDIMGSNQENMLV